MPPCPARNLRQFAGQQWSHPVAVELGQRRERHVVDIQVQTHADGVRGHQIVDVSVLVHLNLRIPRAWAKRAHHHCDPALLAAHQFCNGIEVIDREAHNGRAPRHPAQLFRSGVDQLRESLAPQELHVGDQPRNHRPHGVRAHEQGFLRAAHMQQAVSKDVAPLGIRAELDFINGNKVGAQTQRHRLDCCDPILSAVGDDALLSGNKCHRIGAAQAD